MTSTTDREPTAREIEREAEASRQRLSSTLDELRENLTPGHVVEEILDNAKDGGASMLRALGRAARDNPIPALLIGTGCAMFLMGAGGAGATRGARSASRRHAEHEEEHGRYRGGRLRAASGPRWHGEGDGRQGRGEHESRISDLASGARETVRYNAEAAMEGVSAGLSSARGAVADTAAELRERARRVVEGVGETAQAYSGVAVDAARHTGERVAGSVRDTMHRSSERVRENVGSLLHEQPLVLGAIGVAIGAAIGALLPRTQAEDRMLGETADALKSSAAQLAEEQYARARDTATKVVDDVREAASDHGLTPDKAGEVVGELGRRVKQAAGLDEQRSDNQDRPLQQAASEPRRSGGGQMQGGGTQSGRQMQGSDVPPGTRRS